MLATLFCAAVIVLALLMAAMRVLDPLLSRLGEVKECLARLENIRRTQKEMHDLAYEWWVLDLMRQRDELLQRKGLPEAASKEATP